MCYWIYNIFEYICHINVESNGTEYLSEQEKEKESNKKSENKKNQIIQRRDNESNQSIRDDEIMPSKRSPNLNRYEYGKSIDDDHELQRKEIVLDICSSEEERENSDEEWVMCIDKIL